jgi:hypothetical protein
MNERNYRFELTIELMQRLEDSVAQLYEIYARKFPDYANFWMTLALQENMHADLIRGLGAMVSSGTIAFKEDRFSIEQLQQAFDNLQHELQIARQTDYSLSKATAIALNLEESLIEKSFFEIFESDSQEMKDVFADLARDTQEHIKKLTQFTSSLSSQSD